MRLRHFTNIGESRTSASCWDLTSLREKEGEDAHPKNKSIPELSQPTQDDSGLSPYEWSNPGQGPFEISSMPCDNDTYL